MFHLIVTGPDANQHSRLEAAVDYRTRIGRSPPEGWSIPWDMRISREHAELQFRSDRLEVRCLDSARNSAVLNGNAVRTFAVRPGEEFRIGQTTFRLERTSESRGPSKKLFKRAKQTPSPKDEDIANQLEAALNFLEDDRQSDFTPEYCDDHLPVLPSDSVNRGSVAKRSSSIGELAQKFLQLEGQLEGAIAEQERLAALNIKAQRESQTLRQELAKRDEELATLEELAQQQLHGQREQFDERLAAATRDWRQERDEASQKLKSSEQEKRRLATELSELENVRQQLQERVEEAQISSQQSVAERDKVDAKLVKLVHQQEQQQELFHTEHTRYRERIAKLESSLAEQTADRDRLTSEISDLQQSMGTLQQRAAKSAESHQEAIASKERRIQGLEQQLRNQEHQLTKLKETKASLEESGKLEEATVAKLNAQLARSDETNRSLTDDLENHQAALASRTEEWQRMRAELISQREKFLRDAEHRVAEDVFESTLNEERRRSESLTERISELERINKEQGARLSDAATDREQLEETLRKASCEQQALEQQTETLQRALAEMNLSVDQIRQANLDLQKTSESLRRETATHEARIASQCETETQLRAEAEDLKKQLDTAQSSVSELHQELEQLSGTLRAETEASKSDRTRFESLQVEANERIEEQARALASSAQQSQTDQQTIRALQASLRDCEERLRSDLVLHDQAEREREESRLETTRVRIQAGQARCAIEELLEQREARLSEAEARIKQLEEQSRQNALIAQAEDSAKSEAEPDDVVMRLKLLAARRRKLIEWQQEQLEKTRGLLQRQAAEHRKANARSRRLANELEMLQHQQNPSDPEQGPPAAQVPDPRDTEFDDIGGQSPS